MCPIVLGRPAKPGARLDAIPPYRGWRIFGGILLAIRRPHRHRDPVAPTFALAVLAGVWLIVIGVWQITEEFVTGRHGNQLVVLPG
jgi:uncharacterized membrane protein HdeD (DUF308 family)